MFLNIYLRRIISHCENNTYSFNQSDNKRTQRQIHKATTEFIRGEGILQSVNKSRSLFQENFVLLIEKKTNTVLHLLSLILKFIYLIKFNLFLVSPDHAQNSFHKVPF